MGSVAPTWIMDQEQHGDFTYSICRKVLLSSPKVANYKALKNAFLPNVKNLFLPLPSDADVIHIAALCGINEVEARRRISIVGRIPRYVCTMEFSFEVRETEKAIRRCNFDPTILHSQVVLQERIFVEEGDENFYIEKPFPSFASSYIADLYMQQWKDRNYEQFKSFLATNGSANDLVIPYGHAFEAYAHDVLSAGGKFRIWQLCGLDNSNPTEVYDEPVAIPRRQILVVPTNDIDFATLGNYESKYLKPLAGNFGAVNSLVVLPLVKNTSTPPLRSIVTYQMTTNIHHGINGPALEAMITKLKAVHGDDICIVFIFVVPAYLFTAFKKQTYKGAFPHASLQCAKQYVLSISTDMEIVGEKRKH